MRNIKINMRKFTLLAGLAFSSLTILTCNAYDIMGQMYPSKTTRELKVFVSSANIMFSGTPTISPSIAVCTGLTGLSVGNCMCQQLASNQGLSSNGSIFRAWLSDSIMTDAVCNIQGKTGRYPSCGDPVSSELKYSDPNNLVIFGSWNEIVSGSLPSNTITTNEFKGIYNGIVWTGTANGGIYLSMGGTSSANTCSDWTGVGGTGISGNSNILTSWTSSMIPGTTGCPTPYPIYCFEQP